MKSSGAIVILTGAGISAESGIRTFRASDGLWENHAIDDVATPEGFARNPELVLDFYNKRRQQLLQPKTTPNKAHYALAQLEAEYDEEVIVITQNIDNLHERAGSVNVIHMHGELLKRHCTACNAITDILQDMQRTDLCPHCQQPSLRPHIVWFGEMPLAMDTIYSYLEHCAIFSAIGTSGRVYPAAGFAQTARQSGAICYQLNIEPIESPWFEHNLYGKATETVVSWVNQTLRTTV